MVMKVRLNQGLPYFRIKSKCVELDYSHDEKYCLGCDFFVENQGLCSFDDIADALVGDLPRNCCINVVVTDRECAYFSSVRFARKRKEILLRGAVLYNMLEWDGEIGVMKLAAVIADGLAASGFLEVEGPYICEGYITIEFTKKINPELTIREETSAVDAFLVKAHREYQERFELLSGVLTKISVAYEYRHVFCQYLAYFGQFLADMGISAETSVASRGDHILLNVKPRDKNEAIQNIYLALASYLALPDGDPLVIPAKDALSQVRYQQLLANVEHLKTQLALTQAIVAVKNEQINLLERAGGLNDMCLALGRTEKPTTPERWELMEGVALTKYKGRLFEIDVPALLRRLTGKQ